MNLFTLGMEDAINDHMKDRRFVEYEEYLAGYVKGESMFAKEYALCEALSAYEYKQTELD